MAWIGVDFQDIQLTSCHLNPDYLDSYTLTVMLQDVLVATDVASKGLDFPEIQHVINFDMPDEIENYVHRIGRTGRCGKTGIATTFINKNQVYFRLDTGLRSMCQSERAYTESVQDP